MQRTHRRKKGGERTNHLNGTVAAVSSENEPRLQYGNGDVSVPMLTNFHIQTVSSEDKVVSDDFSKIVNLVRSIAPTAEEEDFEPPVSRRSNDTVIEMGDEEEILGLDYPHEASTFLAEDVDVGHFLCGGGGLDALSLHDPEEAEDEVDSRIFIPPPQPALASCSTLWDNHLRLCDIPYCGKRASSKCAACQGAFYCGSVHQNTDWENHKQYCSPFTKSFLTTAQGRGVTEGMVSTRKISQGQELFSEKPLLLFPLVSANDSDHSLECPGIERNNLCRITDPSCLGCNKSFEFVGSSCHRCSTCTLPLCSKACEYLVSHKLGECQAILEGSLKVSEHNVFIPCLHALYMDVEILRALRLRKVDESLFLNLIDLQYNSRVKSYADSFHFRRFKRDVEKIVPLSVAYSKRNLGLVNALHAIITTNSFRPSLSSTFKLIFRRQADFIHSCLPNTVHYLENECSRDPLKMRLVTKAGVTIPSDEVIWIDFLPTPYLPYARRQRLLRAMGVQCFCSRCALPDLIGDFSIELKCRHCRHGMVRPEEVRRWSESVWACSFCLEETPFEVIDRTEKEISVQLMDLPKRNYEDIPGLVKFAARIVETLNPAHPLFIYTWCFIESILRKRNEAVREPNPDKRYDDTALRDCRLMAEYADIILPHLDVIRQGLWVDKGLVLFNKFYAHFILCCEEFHQGRTDRKHYTTMFFKCLKILDMSLQHLTPFEGMGASNQTIWSTIQEATTALILLKDVAAELIQHQTRPRWKQS